MAIPVKLPTFEGPLDLLLHLIEKNKIDIYDIPIVTITEQYMDYIKKMESKDLNVMSEFLLMAATLLEIKCRMLLPAEVVEDEEEDPRSELVARLLQYKMFKYMSEELKEREENFSLRYYKNPSLPHEVEEYIEPIDIDALLCDVDLDAIYKVFQDMMKRQVDKIDPIRSHYGRIEKEEVSLTKTLSYVGDYAKLHKNFSFRSLIREDATKIEVVVTFLAILELMRLGELKVIQKNAFDEISLESVIAS